MLVSLNFLAKLVLQRHSCQYLFNFNIELLQTNQVLLAMSSALEGISARLVLAYLFPLSSKYVKIVDEQIMLRIGPKISFAIA